MAYTNLLHASTAIKLRGKLHHVTLHLACKKLLLNHGAVLKELLHDIVAKDVHHESVGVDHNFVKNTLPIVAIGSRYLFLQKSGTLLVARKFNNTTKHVLERMISILDE